MTEHTPGPWQLESRGDGTYDLWHKGTFAGIDWGRGAPDRLEPDDVQTFEANARLIAAAPETAAERDRLREINAELLAALESLLQQVFEYGGAGERLGADFEKVWNDNVGKLYEFDARDVIAKTRKQE